MAQAQRAEQDELKELRERVVALEEELKEERGKKSEEDEDREVFEKTRDEVNKLFRGFFYAGLESLAVTADMTRSFVDKASKRNDKHDKLSESINNLPRDSYEGLLDAIDDTVDKTTSIIDKFNEKYKDKRE